MDTSEFSDVQQSFPDAELLSVGGSTCDCYRVKLYGKLHFMKRLKPELRTDPRYVSALQKEFETGYPLDHPHLVRYLSKGDDYLMTDYVDGENLKQFVATHPDYFKSRKNTNRFLTQLLDVVGYLHQHQVIHLDLKPSNILMTRIGHDVKLADLGYCYTDTYTDTMGRTNKYSAPEQIHGEQVDARTDIYAIGKILETLPLPSIYNKVKDRCLKGLPAERFQTTEEIKELTAKPNYSYYFLALTGIIVVTISVILWWSGRQEEQIPSINDNFPVASSPVDSDSIEKAASIVPERSLNIFDERNRETRLLKSEIPHLIDPIYQKTIATFNLEKTGPDLDVWMPLHKAYVEGVNELPPKLKSKYPLVDEIEISRLLWEYARPPLQEILDEIDKDREKDM